VQRAAHTFVFSLFVESIGDGQRVRIEFDDAVDRGALLVDLLDAREIFFGDGASGVLAAL